MTEIFKATIFSAAALSLAACASSGGGDSDAWPGDVSASSTPSSEATTADWEAASGANKSAGEMSNDKMADAGGAAEAAMPEASASTPDGVISKDQLKNIFDPSKKTRGMMQKVDFGESLVTFEFASANVDATSDTTLAQIEEIGYFLQDPDTADREFVLVGHTDAVGDASYNEALSKQRAQSVLNLLKEKFPNIYPKITVVGAGETELKVPEAGRSSVNRRVELRAVIKPDEEN